MANNRLQLVSIILIQAIVIAAVLLTAYWWGWAKPREALPEALIAVDHEVADSYFHLLESRLALTGLTKLHPASSRFNTQRQRIFDSLTTLNEQGADISNHPIILHSLAGAPTDSLRFYNDTLPAQLASLHERHQAIVHHYQAALTQLLTAEEELTKLLQYRPRRDLEALNPTSDREMLLTRSRAAYDGMGAIADRLEKLAAPAPEKTELLNSIASARTLLTTLIERLEAGDEEGAASVRAEFITQYSVVRVQAFAVELAVIKSDATVQTLTEQTNVLYEYEEQRRQIREALLSLGRP